MSAERDALGREWHELFHRAWTAAACGRPYVKADWHRLDQIASALMREAGIAPPFGLPQPGDRLEEPIAGPRDSAQMHFRLDGECLRYWRDGEAGPGPLDWIGGRGPRMYSFREILSVSPGRVMLRGLTANGSRAEMSLTWDVSKPFDETCTITVDRLT